MERVKLPYPVQRKRRIAMLAFVREQRLFQSSPLVRSFASLTLDTHPHLTIKQLLAKIDEARDTDEVLSMVAQTAAAVRHRMPLPLRSDRQEMAVLQAVNAAYQKCVREAEAERGLPMKPGHDWESESAIYLEGKLSRPLTTRSSR